MSSNFTDIEQLFATVGLDSRGAFHPVSDDRVPPLATGEAVRTLVLAGNSGPRMWRRYADACRNGLLTLDAWSEEVLRELAAQLRAGAAFPFERPCLPFQRLAMRAQVCHPSVGAP